MRAGQALKPIRFAVDQQYRAAAAGGIRKAEREREAGFPIARRGAGDGEDAAFVGAVVDLQHGADLVNAMGGDRRLLRDLAEAIGEIGQDAEQGQAGGRSWPVASSLVAVSRRVHEADQEA